MKRISLICGLIATSITAGFAQDDDALTFAGRALRMSSTNPVLGSARYTGMGGAMSALGGDGAAIKDNPAALGIYRKSDIGLTANVNADNEGNTNFNINNFTAVFNFGRSGNSNGYVTSSLGITYNRLNNFNRTTYTDGTFLLEGRNTEYYNEFYENDGSGIWNFNYGMNISNKVFVGAGLNVMSLSYKQKTMTDINNSWEENTFETDGNGINLGLGVIVKPTDAVRIGASITTPTWMNLKESAEYPWRDDFGFTYVNKFGELEYAGYGYDYTPEAEYKIQAPMKANLGLGFVLGKRALIGVDYTYQNFNAMKIKDADKHIFREARAFTEDNYNAMHTLKAGTEIQIAKGFAVRAGFAHQTSPTEDKCNTKDDRRKPLYNHGLYVPYFYDQVAYSYAIPREANYFTLGAGYHGKVFYCDLAYAQKNQKEDFYVWQSTDIQRTEETDKLGIDPRKDGWTMNPIKQTLKTRDIMLTLGVKF